MTIDTQDTLLKDILLAPAPIKKGAWRAKGGRHCEAMRVKCEALPRVPLLDIMVISARMNGKVVKQKRRTGNEEEFISAC